MLNLVRQLRRAQQGSRVIIVAAHHEAAVTAFRSTAELLSSSAFAGNEVKTIRTNGLEAVKFPNGGEVRFLATPRGLRGMSADLVMIDKRISSETTLAGTRFRETLFRDAALVTLVRGGAVKWY